MAASKVAAAAEVPAVDDINKIPLKSQAQGQVTVADIGVAKDAQQIQTNLVRVDGQPSVYLPVLKQGGDSNTISVVEGIRRAVGRLACSMDSAAFLSKLINTCSIRIGSTMILGRLGAM